MFIPKCKSHCAWTLDLEPSRSAIRPVGQRLIEGKASPVGQGERGGQDAGLSSTKTKTRYRNACVTIMLLGLNSLFKLSCVTCLTCVGHKTIAMKI